MPNDAKDALAVIPWYWRDWRASTARAVLARSPIAGWCYRELLDAMWASPTCDLPPDDESLAALAGVTDAEWASAKTLVLRFLPLDETTGRRFHPRSRHEHAKASAYRDGCRAGGRATAAKRWGRNSLPTSTLPPPNRTPSPSPSPKEEEEEEQTRTGEAPGGRGVEVLKPKHSPAEQAARDLAKALGSGLPPCRKQILALKEAGWELERIRAALPYAEPGMAPWDWTKLARTGGQIQPRFPDHTPKPPSSNGALLQQLAAEQSRAAADLEAFKASGLKSRAEWIEHKRKVVS